MLTKDPLGNRGGGIHDHVGGGFHRYSTDRMWLVPHFEKCYTTTLVTVLVKLTSWPMGPVTPGSGGTLTFLLRGNGRSHRRLRRHRLDRRQRRGYHTWTPTKSARCRPTPPDASSKLRRASRTSRIAMCCSGRKPGHCRPRQRNWPRRAGAAGLRGTAKPRVDTRFSPTGTAWRFGPADAGRLLGKDEFTLVAAKTADCAGEPSRRRG
jgi:hypothetical protein